MRSAECALPPLNPQLSTHSKAHARIEKMLDRLPAGEIEFIGQMMGRVDTAKFVAADYGIG